MAKTKQKKAGKKANKKAEKKAERKAKAVILEAYNKAMEPTRAFDKQFKSSIEKTTAIACLKFDSAGVPYAVDRAGKVLHIA